MPVESLRAPVGLLRDLGPAGFAAFQLIVGGSVLAALVYPIFVALLCARLAAGAPIYDASFGGLHMAALVGGLTATVIVNLVGLARRRLLSHAWVVALLPFYWLLLSAAAWQAVLQLAREPYRWEKTEHGLARSSRRAQRTAPPARHARTTDTFAKLRQPLRASASR